MTPEEEVKMLNEDHEIWKQSREHARKCSVPDICDVPGIEMDEQLEEIILNWRGLSKYNPNRYQTFAGASVLYINRKSAIPLCTTDEHLARLWISQINERLQTARENAISELNSHNKSTVGLFSARCVDMHIDPIIGDRDISIAGMHYIGVVVSYYNAERDNNYAHAKECEYTYNSMFNQTQSLED